MTFLKRSKKMLKSKRNAIIMLWVFVGMFTFLQTHRAEAVPSFARQTGMSCNTCHIAFPELTPFGRNFKLTGYVISKSTKPYEFPPPVAGVLQLSFTHTNKAQPRGSVDDNWATHVTSSGNNIISLPQQSSLFYGGKIFDHIGGLVQGTVDGASNNFFLDNTDIRYSNNTQLAGKNFVYGLTINNNPTVQDVWNTASAWRFPYASSSVAPTPAAGTVVDGALAQQVGGIGAYAYWNDLLYGEVAVYRTAKNGITEPLGAGMKTDTVVNGAVPYWRLALQHQWEKHSLELGTYGLYAKVSPEGRTSGPTDKFTDIALDAQYQYIGKKHLLSAEATWIHEDQDWDASFPQGNTARPSSFLNTFKANANYYYISRFGKLGGTVAYFSTTGPRNILLYAPDPVDGSRTGSPNSSGFIFELDYLRLEVTKFLSFKSSLQYTLYTKFNGAHTNYDGFNRNASDNNTLYFLLWLAF
jgi:hypothetical protein